MPKQTHLHIQTLPKQTHLPKKHMNNSIQTYSNHTNTTPRLTCITHEHSPPPSPFPLPTPTPTLAWKSTIINFRAVPSLLSTALYDIMAQYMHRHTLEKPPLCPQERSIIEQVALWHWRTVFPHACPSPWRTKTQVVEIAQLYEKIHCRHLSND